MPLAIECFAISHIGNYRKNNEDNYYIGKYLTLEEQSLLSQEHRKYYSHNITTDESENRIFAVSDGMGGHEYGEVASYIVVHALDKFNKENLNRCTKKKEKFAYIQAFQKVIDIANREINDFAISKNVGDNMGATLSGVIVFSNEIAPFNIGDSETFIYEKGSLTKLTTDDNEASIFGNANINNQESKGKRLTKYFGLPKSHGTLTATISKPISLKAGQIFITATDGLTDSLTTDEISNIIKNKTDTVGDTVNAILNKALSKDRGGRDNITIVMMKITKKRKGDTK